MYWGLLVVLLAVVVPWLIWGRYPTRTRAASLARSPIIVTRRAPASTPQAGERGILDFRRHAERSAYAMNDVLIKVGDETARQGKRMQRHTRRLERAKEKGVGIDKLYRLSERAARDLNSHAADLDRLETRLRKERETMITNTTAWLRYVPPADEADQFRAVFRELSGTAKGARLSTEQYRNAIRGLRRNNISQPVNVAADNLVEVVSRLVEDMAATERFYQTQGRRPRGQTQAR